MGRVLTLTQTQLACPSRFIATLENGETIEFCHRLCYPFNTDNWRVYIAGTEEEVITQISNDIEAITTVYKDKYDFSETQITLIKEEVYDDIWTTLEG